MSKTRDNYQVTGNNIQEVLQSLNFLLQRLADRMDKIEGIRGTAEINSNLDLNGNRVVDLLSSVSNTDGVNRSEIPDQGLGSADSPTFSNLTISVNLTVSGDLTVSGVGTFADLVVTDSVTLTCATDTTGYIKYTDSNGEILHSFGN